MISHVWGVLRNRCPYCQEGQVFKSLSKMRDKCASCGEFFSREPGYFLGAMIASYFIGVFSLVPTVILSIFVFGLPVSTMIMIGVVQILIFTPLLFRLSRLAWIYADVRMSRALQNK